MLKYEDYVRRKQNRKGLIKWEKIKGWGSQVIFVDLDQSVQWLINGKLSSALIESLECFAARVRDSSN